MKYLWMLVVGLLIFAWFKVRPGRSSALPPSSTKEKAEVSVRPKNMVACAYCGLHLPQEDAIFAIGRTYCCVDHLQKDQAKHARSNG